MKERKMTINLAWANIFSFVLLAAVAIVAFGAFYLLWGIDGFTPDVDPEDKEAYGEAMSMGSLKFFLYIVISIVVHEGIHGLTWGYYAKSKWKSISFGVIWKMLTPYCHCNEPLLLKNYIVGALMPLMILGILPSLLSLCLGSAFWLAFGVIGIASASGDILVAWKLRKEPRNCQVLDHPSEAGCIIYDEE